MATSSRANSPGARCKSWQPSAVVRSIRFDGTRPPEEEPLARGPQNRVGGERPVNQKLARRWRAGLLPIVLVVLAEPTWAAVPGRSALDRRWRRDRGERGPAHRPRLRRVVAGAGASARGARRGGAGG